MDYEPGDEYACDVCGGTHEVRDGKSVRVAGSTKRLDGTPYVRCPESGVVTLDGDEPADDGEDWP